MAFPVVPMILLCQWNTKALPNLVAEWQDISSSALKSTGTGIIQPENITDFATVRILVLLPHVGTWSISIRKKIFVLISEPFAELRNGMIPIKSGLLSKETSITSKITYALQDAEPKTRRLYMLIWFWPVSHSSLQLSLQTKSSTMNTFEAYPPHSLGLTNSIKPIAY